MTKKFNYFWNIEKKNFHKIFADFFQSSKIIFEICHNVLMFFYQKSGVNKDLENDVLYMITSLIPFFTRPVYDFYP